jgi:hypothetical protein
MTRDEAMRYHPSSYWLRVYSPQDADDAATAAHTIAPVIDIRTRVVSK